MVSTYDSQIALLFTPLGWSLVVSVSTCRRGSYASWCAIPPWTLPGSPTKWLSTGRTNWSRNRGVTAHRNSSSSVGSSSIGSVLRDETEAPWHERQQFGHGRAYPADGHAWVVAGQLGALRRAPPLPVSYRRPSSLQRLPRETPHRGSCTRQELDAGTRTPPGRGPDVGEGPFQDRGMLKLADGAVVGIRRPPTSHSEACGIWERRRHSSSSWRHRCTLGLLPWSVRTSCTWFQTICCVHPTLWLPSSRHQRWATVARRSSFETDQQRLEDGKGKSGIVHIQVASSSSLIFRH